MGRKNTVSASVRLDFVLETIGAIDIISVGLSLFFVSLCLLSNEVGTVRLPIPLSCQNAVCLGDPHGYSRFVFNILSQLCVSNPDCRVYRAEKEHLSNSLAVKLLDMIQAPSIGCTQVRWRGTALRGQSYRQHAKWLAICRHSYGRLNVNHWQAQLCQMQYDCCQQLLEKASLCSSIYCSIVLCCGKDCTILGVYSHSGSFIESFRTFI